MLSAERKKRHKFCKKTQNFRHFLRPTEAGVMCSDGYSIQPVKDFTHRIIMYHRYILLSIATTLFTLLLSSCATQREISGNRIADTTDTRPCMANFSMKGSFWSGRVAKSFQEYPNSSKNSAFPYLMSKLASIGYTINSSDKDTGLISASFPITMGQGSTTSLNVTVITRNPTGVQVNLIFTAAGTVAFSLDDLQKEFCSILDDVPANR